MHPNTPVSPSAAWMGGQELTRSEVVSFQKAHRRLVFGMVSLVVGICLGVGLLASQLQKDRPLMRVKYHQNGETKLQATYLSGLRHGVWQRWYENGQLMERGEFFKGRPDGCWVHYFDTGDVAKRACYDKGLYEGHVISYSRNGTIRQNQFFQKGLMTPVVPFHPTLMARR